MKPNQKKTSSMTYVVDDGEANMNLSLEMNYNDKSQEVTDYR